MPKIERDMAKSVASNISKWARIGEDKAKSAEHVEPRREQKKHSDRSSSNNANLGNFSWVWRVSWVFWLKSIGFDRNTDHTLIRNSQQRGGFFRCLFPLLSFDTSVFAGSCIVHSDSIFRLHRLHYVSILVALEMLISRNGLSMSQRVSEQAREKERRKTIKTWESSLQHFFLVLFVAWFCFSAIFFNRLE